MNTKLRMLLPLILLLCMYEANEEGNLYPQWKEIHRQITG